MAEKLAESEKSLEAPRAEMLSMKEQVARANTEMVDSNKCVAEVCEEPEHRMVRLNVALVGRNRAEKLARSLVT